MGNEQLVSLIIKKLVSSKRVLIICHVDPDGDTVWSAAALAEMLKQKKIKVKIVCKDRVPDTVAIFPETKILDTQLPRNWQWDCVVAMEAGDTKRLGFDMPVDINIDHHPDNTHYGQLNWIDGKASACGSLIYQLAKIGSFKINTTMATLLYAAICSDTGGFRFGNTNQQTFADAYELVKKGAKPDQIYHAVYENVSLKMLQALGHSLQELKVIEKGKVVYSVAEKVTAETGHGIIDVIRTVKGTEIAVLFKEEAVRKIKVSLRSKSSFNVQAIAKKFGGGGHIKAAGCTINAPLSLAKSKVLKEIKKALTCA